MPLLDEPQHFCCLEAIEHDNRHANERCHCNVRNETSDMEERGNPDDDVVAIERHPFLVDCRTKHNVGMCAHCPFRLSRGTRRIDQHSNICRGKASNLNGSSLKLAQQFKHIECPLKPLFLG